MTSFDREINKVLLVIAMEAEAKPLLDSLQLQQVVHAQEQSLQYAPFHLYQGEKKLLQR
jgi:purine nucleoside permease